MTTQSPISRAAQEHKRLAQESADLARAAKDRQERSREQRAEYDRLAKSLKLRHSLQTEVTARVNDKTTLDLVAMISHLVLTPNTKAVWVAVAPTVARDVLQRAYPLGIQRGVIARVSEKEYSLRYANGSRLEFWWPGKKPIDTIQIMGKTK